MIAEQASRKSRKPMRAIALPASWGRGDPLAGLEPSAPLSANPEIAATTSRM